MVHQHNNNMPSTNTTIALICPNICFRHAELQYLDAVKRIISEGAMRPNRTGVDSRAIFGMQMRYSLRESKAKIFIFFNFFLFKSWVVLVFCDQYS